MSRFVAKLQVLVALIAAVIVPGQAMGAEVTFDVPDAVDVQTEDVAYACGNTVVSAKYVNAGSTSLALLSLNGQFVVASNVLSGSGAKYAGRQYIWWTKGDDASLYDLMKGEDAALVSCTKRP
jgi:membrane-bound inhibitor of C-type lysozyme